MADTWNRANEQINKATERAEEIGQTAAARVEDVRVQAVSALETAAYRLEEKVDKVPGIAHKIADYLRDHDAKAMMKDAENLVHRYPTRFLAGGIVLGFFLARGFRRSDY
jgi:hypothetical protein